MRLLILSGPGRGGIADYAHDQASALAARGLDVEVLCSPSFLEQREFTYKTTATLHELWGPTPSGSVLARKIRVVLGILKNIDILRSYLEEQRPDAVLMHFSEYLAPLWAGRLRAVRRKGITFHSVLHDPVRDHRVGPGWWHKLSVKEAFSFLDTVFVHTHESVPVPDPVKVVWIPHGIYRYPKAGRSRAAVRHELSIPLSAKILVAFGYIRDNKNLDLVIRAIAGLDDLYLVVAGGEQGGGNKPISFYIELAETLGCADRCRWLDRYLSPEEVADILCASDLSMLTYSRTFLSASGALGVTANYELPCLISSGSQTTKTLVQRFGLGVWVEPDSVDAIRAGLETWLHAGLSPDWETYEQENSWAKNAELVHEAISAAMKTANRLQGEAPHA